MPGSPNQPRGIPRLSSGSRMSFRRSEYLDGTLKVFFGPGQFFDSEADEYSPPTDWPAAGTLLRVPKVVRFFWDYQEWDNSPLTPPPQPPPTDPNPPTGPGVTVNSTQLDQWYYAIYQDDVTGHKVSIATPLELGYLDNRGSWVSTPPDVDHEFPTHVDGANGSNPETRIATGTTGTWWVIEYRTPSGYVTHTVPSPAPDANVPPFN